MRQKGLREMDKCIERKVFPQAPHHPPPWADREGGCEL
jgi:hypothetical protein